MNSTEIEYLNEVLINYLERFQTAISTKNIRDLNYYFSELLKTDFFDRLIKLNNTNPTELHNIKLFKNDYYILLFQYFTNILENFKDYFPETYNSLNNNIRQKMQSQVKKQFTLKQFKEIFKRINEIINDNTLRAEGVLVNAEQNPPCIKGMRNKKPCLIMGGSKNKVKKSKKSKKSKKVKKSKKN